MADTTTEEQSGPRSQMWKHEAMVPYLESEFGVTLSKCSPAEIIAMAFARRNPWRASDTYANLVESHKGDAEAAKAERAAEREAAKAERAEAAATAKAEKQAAAAKAKAEAPAKAPAKKATKATKAPAKATKASKAAAPAEDPFA